MKTTGIIQKSIPSLINVIVVIALASPFYLIDKSYGMFKIILIIFFFGYNLFFLIFYKNRDLGMMIARTYWNEEYPVQNKLIYIVLYTASFATLVYWIWFPFDLLLINLIFFQLPCVLLTGTTLHGYIAGNMVTVSKDN